MRSQLRGHGFNTRIRHLFWRFFWRFWHFFWRFFSIASAHDMHWTQSQTTRNLFWRFFGRFWRFFRLFFWRFFSITSAHDMHWTHALDFFALHKGFTGFTGTARVAVVVAELVALSVAVVAAVVVLFEVADRLDVDPKKGFGRAWRTHSSQITQSSAQSECFCRRVQRSDSAKDKKATVSAFLEWHTLQGIVWSRA